MRDQQAVNIKEGAALRHALIHCGGLMRAQSQVLIVAIIGIVTAQTAMQRPGGSPWVKESYSGNWSISSSLPTIDALYVAFLRRVGLEAEAQYALAEESADQQVGSITPSWAYVISSIYERSLRHLMWCWVASLILLVGVLGLLLLRVLVAVLALFAAVRTTRPLPGWASWGVPAGTFAAIGVLFCYCLYALNNLATSLEDLPAALVNSLFQSSEYLPLGIINSLFLFTVSMSVLLLWRARRLLHLRRAQGRQFQRRSIGRGLGIAALTCAGWCGIYALAQWQSTGPQDYVGPMTGG